MGVHFGGFVSINIQQAMSSVHNGLHRCEHSFFLDYYFCFDIMKMKGSDLMRKKRIRSTYAIILIVLMLCSGCAAFLQELDNTAVRQNTETMLDSLIANDFQTAYSLVHNFCSEEEFKAKFPKMRELLGNTDTYELKLLSIYTNYTLSNGNKRNVVTSVYEMTSESCRVIVNVRIVDQNDLASFYLTPYEKTDYYFTGTLNNMTDADWIQWSFLLLNVLTLGLAIFAFVDCCKQKIKNKALWLLLLSLGFASLGATISSAGFKIHFNLEWITAYSALIRYGSGIVTLRLMLPVGAIIYCIMRRRLLKDNAQTIAASDNEFESLEESCADQPASQAPESDEIESQQID